MLPILLQAESPPAKVFRLHLYSEPNSFSPYLQRTSSAAYLLAQLHGSFLVYQDQKLQPGYFEKCDYNKSLTELKCNPRKNLKWSDGSAMTTEHLIQSFRNFIDPKNQALRADLLFPVKNARDIFAGKKTSLELGIKLEKQKMVFNLEEPNSEFIYNLANPLLAPTLIPLPEPNNLKAYVTSGAYRFKERAAGKSIVLEPNPFFYKDMKRAPLLEFLILSEDTVALSLFEKKELSFHRRLPTLLIPKWTGKSEFFEVPQVRFDYFGFAKELRGQPELRRALAQSLDYMELANLYHAKPRPGCPGLLPDWLKNKTCIEFDVKTGKSSLEKVDKTKVPKLTLAYSKQGGNDHQRTMEWIQSQWKKNLDIQITIDEQENKIFVANLEKSPPPIFRKGVSLDRPTCASALEAFRSNDAEDFLKIEDTEFQKTLKELSRTRKPAQQKALCSKAVDYLLSNFLLIPTGPIYFSILVQPEWKGWKLNELNQLDLSELH